ncbi:DEAD/DEAH box helicase [Eleftheria terrae]|uniref:DEAD/DEAH box helicase n=1 Tax=Eleftheria terrae TaxID=1597781 RepID=UPI00263BDB11|nr:DEAD/DEAH box helicase [Eleftheria terrae]WKB51439.1 DEAD/DEAH box helicase [Eleftheria terrae]
MSQFLDPPAPADSEPRLWPPTAGMLRRLFDAVELQGGRALGGGAVHELQVDAHGATARVHGLDHRPYEVAVHAGRDAQGRPHYSARCSCRVGRFCRHAAAVLLRLQEGADAEQRGAAVQAWAQALRLHADREQLRRLPELDAADAARVLGLLREATALTDAPDAPDAPAESPAPQAPAPTPPAPAASAPALPGRPRTAEAEAARFQPRLTLQTLGRGDGLLGLKPSGPFGPRGDPVTVARVDWTYRGNAGLRWETAAPVSVLNSRPPAVERVPGPQGRPVWLQRDRAAEADAMDRLWATGLLPLPAQLLQWRSREAGEGCGPLWTLTQEERFGDFWAEQVPALRAAGWSVVVCPGFAHESVPVTAWRLVVDADSGEVLGKEIDGPAAAPRRTVQALRLPGRTGSWLVTLGIEVDGQRMDLAPLLADLLARDTRWLDASRIAAIDDQAVVLLRAPGGRRIEAPAAPLKAIVGAMVDLLTDPQRRDGPLRLSPWDMHRLEALQQGLLDAPAGAAAGGWQLQGEAGLLALARRLQHSGSPRPVAPPAGLGLSLRPYQREGLAWLQYLREQGLAGILADDMGLGKTAQALAHVLLEREAGRLDRPALVVLPTSLLFNWQAEAARVAPGLRVLALQGPQRALGFEAIARHDLVLTTYPLLWRDLEVLQAQPFHLLILDEAQSVKNPASRSARALRQLQARHRLCLTGTPLENHLGELWAHFDFLMPGFLGDARSFARQWRKPIEVNGETLRARLLAQRVRPFILRRRKQDVASELPPKTEVIERIQLQGRQRDLYESVRVAADELVRRALARQGFAGAQISILDALLKLRQVCCDPQLVKGAALPPGMERAKLERLLEMLQELVAEGRRVLVFSQFTEMLSLIEAELDRLRLPCLVLTGETPAAERGERVRRFQARERPVMLVSLKAGGVGLNLTAADTVIHFDPWWNPAVEQQATDRAHRLGQDQPVFVYKLVVEGSIEERMLEWQARKAALAEGVLGQDSEGATKFSAEELQALLAPLRSPQ